MSAASVVLPEGSQTIARWTRFSSTTVCPLISAAARTTSSGPAPRRVRGGERLVDALGPAHRVRLAAEDQRVDDLGHLQEVDVLGEGDERQAA